MKKFLPLLFLLFACTPSKVEKLIIDYEQTLDRSKIDLSMKILKLNESGKIMVQDSIKYYQAKVDSMLKELSGNKLRSFESVNGTLDTLVNSYTHILKMNYSDSFAQKLTYWLSIRNTLTHNNNLLLKYSKQPEGLIALKYDCTYKIKNPMLNFASQTISKVYYISPEKDRILKTVIQQQN